MIKLIIDNTTAPIDLTVPKPSPVAKWYKGDKPDREISPEGFELGLYITNDGTLYRDHAKPLLERIAKAVRGKYYSPRWETRRWLAYVSETIAAYRQKVDRAAAFTPQACLEAALYAANHYRDYLAETHGVVIEELKQ